MAQKTSDMTPEKKPQNKYSVESLQIRMQRLSPAENIAVGITTALIEVSINQWMLYVKNCVQQNIKPSLNPRIMYRGFFASATNICILTGLQFPLTNMVTNVITGGKCRKLSDAEMIFSGFVGGGITGLVCGPMELVMIQQQRFGGTIVNTPLRMVNKLGVTSFSRGLTTSVGREAVFTAGYMGIQPVMQRKLQDSGVSKITAGILGAMLSGTVSGAISQPLDTIKTCMQGDIERKRFTTFTGTAKYLFEEQGYMAFYRGYLWRTGRMISLTVIYAECRRRLSPMMFPHIMEGDL